MADTDTPVQQETSGQQDWEARYKGLMRVLSEKDQKIASLSEALAKHESEKGQLAEQVEQLRKALDERSGELENFRGSYEKEAEKVRQQLEALQKERDSFAAQATKWEVLRQYPDLVHLADVVPSSTDPEQVKSAVERLSQGIEAILSSKREQWKAGVVPPANPPASKLSREEVYANIEKYAGTPQAQEWINLWNEMVK